MSGGIYVEYTLPFNNKSRTFSVFKKYYFCAFVCWLVHMCLRASKVLILLLNYLYYAVLKLHFSSVTGDVIRFEANDVKSRCVILWLNCFLLFQSNTQNMLAKPIQYLCDICLIYLLHRCTVLFITNRR